MKTTAGPGKGHKVPGKIRERIIIAFTFEGKTYTQIMDETHLSKSTIHGVICRYTEKKFKPSEYGSKHKQLTLQL